MHKLTCFMMAAALAGAMVAGLGAPYEMAQKHIEIQNTTASDGLKVAAAQEMMSDASQQAPLSPGMALVLPRSNGDPIVIARRA